MSQIPEYWRLLPFSRLAADEQMARDEAMRAAIERPVARWRQIAPEALVLGHGQPIADVDLDACRAAGLSVYRRASGGAAVLAGPDLLGFDVALPAGHRLALPDVARSYAWLGEALAAGLCSLGVDAALVSPEEARAQARALSAGDPLRLACYAMFSPYEVAVAGRKLVGLAQVRRRTGILLQAGILLHWRPERLVPLLTVPPQSRESIGVSLRQRAVGLEDLLGPVDIAVVIEQLSDAVATATGAELATAGWTPTELVVVAEAGPRYGPLAAVTPGRSPLT